MELKQYLYIIWKRIWIPILLVAVVMAVSLWLQDEPPPQYVATMRFIVSVQPQRLDDGFSYDGYYAAISSEYIADDFSVVISSQAFSHDINRHLADMDSSVRLTPGVVQGVLAAEKQHRILNLSIVWHNPDELAEIGQAVTQALQDEGPSYLALLNTFGGVIKIIDEPSVPGTIPPSLTEQLDLPIRVMLALAVGLGLIFLLEYFDDRIRQRTDLEGLGIPVLAEVGRHKQ